MSPFAWLKKILKIPPGTTLLMPQMAFEPPKPPPFSFTTPPGMAKTEAEAVALKIKADLEKHLGKELILVAMGPVEIVPCNCKLCKMRARAPWN